MRQVPIDRNFLIVGSGRLARHLAHYFDFLKIEYSRWSRRNNTSADLVQKLKSPSTVLLCINDDQINEFIINFASTEHTFVHFSGALEADGAFGFHPLMTFGQELYDLETYEALPFVGSHTPEEFKQVFAELPNPYFSIETSNKALYHSLCVLSGNGTTLLWDLVGKEFQKLGLSQKALDPFLKQVTKNILNNSEGRWSGPWYRNDLTTMEKNIKALEATPLDPLYRELEKISHQSGHDNEKH